jgi:phosphate starvation-inducible PhoH-like protein
MKFRVQYILPLLSMNFQRGISFLNTPPHIGLGANKIIDISMKIKEKVLGNENGGERGGSQKGSKIIVGKSPIGLAGTIDKYKPKTENQKLYMDCLDNNNIHILFGLGPAGCGKTLFACIKAIRELKLGNIDKIVLTRPIVSVDEDLGFLPGTIVNKMDPWTRPIFDIFLEFYSQSQLNFMVQNNIIEISPLAYMRGRTFKRSFIIADEMQNSSPNQMLMMTTRIGEDSRMIITGDLKQSDRGENNGLTDFMKKWKKYSTMHVNETSYVNITTPSIRMVEMEAQDIQRSPIVVKLLDIYNSTDDGGDVFVKEGCGSTLGTTLSSNGAAAKSASKKSSTGMYVKTNVKPNDDAALIPRSHYKPINAADWGGSL